MFNLNFTGAPAGRRGRTPRAGARGPGRSRVAARPRRPSVSSVRAPRAARAGAAHVRHVRATTHDTRKRDIIEQRNNIYRYKFELLFVSARCADVSGFAPLVLTVRERVIRSSTSSLGIATASASGILMCQHRQHKARTKARRPGTPMYTDQCCEDMLKARTPHTTMQMHQKQNARRTLLTRACRSAASGNQTKPRYLLRRCGEVARRHRERTQSAARAVCIVGPRFRAASQGLNAPRG